MGCLVTKKEFNLVTPYTNTNPSTSTLCYTTHIQIHCTHIHSTSSLGFPVFYQNQNIVSMTLYFHVYPGSSSKITTKLRGLSCYKCTSTSNYLTLTYIYNYDPFSMTFIQYLLSLPISKMSMDKHLTLIIVRY